MAVRSELAGRAAAALVGAGTAFTLGWILLGLVNTGDAFPQGPAATLWPLGLVSPFVGGWLAARGERGRARLGVLAGGALLSVAFWSLAPDGWWASGPPPVPTPLR